MVIFMLKAFLIGNRKKARKVFGRKELKIIFRQLEGRSLTQSERNRLSRDIRPKLEFIREAAKFENEFALKKNQSNMAIIGKAVDAIMQDRLKGEVKAILLFGSFADNTFTGRSDIDICAVFRKDISLREATKFRIRVSGQLPEKVDVQVFNILPQKIKKRIAASHKVLYKSSGYDNTAFSIKYLKDDSYSIRMHEIFGVEA